MARLYTCSICRRVLGPEIVRGTMPSEVYGVTEGPASGRILRRYPCQCNRRISDIPNGQSSVRLIPVFYFCEECNEFTDNGVCTCIDSLYIRYSERIPPQGLVMQLIPRVEGPRFVRDTIREHMGVPEALQQVGSRTVDNPHGIETLREASNVNWLHLNAESVMQYERMLNSIRDSRLQPPPIPEPASLEPPPIRFRTAFPLPDENDGSVRQDMIDVVVTMRDELKKDLQEEFTEILAQSLDKLKKELQTYIDEAIEYELKEKRK